jgi:hypothetical protein
MDLSSRWDRGAVLFLLIAVGAMVGCQGLLGGSSSTQDGRLWAIHSTLDFGTVVVGHSRTLTDTLTNASAASVTISSAAASSADFRITAPSFPLTLAAGQSANLTVAFTPHSTGQPSARVAIMSDAANGNEIDVMVGGKAVTSGKLVANPASFSFGQVRVGQSQAQSANLTNSGGTSVTVSQASVSNAAFTLSGLALPITLAAGQSTHFTLTFAPKSAGAINANVSVNGSASLNMNETEDQSESAPTSTVFAASGSGTTPGQVAIAPTSLSFGSVPVGTTQSLTATLTNSGGNSATISQTAALGAGVSVTGLFVPLTLAPGQSTAFQVTFAPTSPGTVTGSITLVSSAANSNLSVAVTGVGVSPGSLTANPATITFGSVQVGSSQSQSATLTNAGGTSLTVSQATTTGTGFTLTALSLPLTLAPAQSAGLTVTFTPQSGGSANGNMALASSAGALNIPLTGSGLTAGSLGASPASVSFGNIQVGSNLAKIVTLTNGSSSSVTISQASASGTGFSLTGIALPLTLSAGQSTTFTATFAPSSGGSANGNIAIASTSSNPSLNIALSGTGVTVGSLAANPTSINFGSVQVGSPQSRPETLTNTGGSPLNISQATLTGAGFTSTGLNVPTTLNAGQSLTFNLVFTPAASGNASGSLSLTADGAVPTLAVSLTGSGTSPGQLAVAPGAFAFGSITVGARQNQTGTLTASGASVTVASAASSNPEFTLSGLSFPATIAAGQSATFTVTFAPQASGTSSGNISFTSNATNAPSGASVTGSGTPAPQHSVSLSWNASTSTVAGYNVYRGSQSGGPYVAVTSAPDASTSYIDSSVTAGQTYYYVVTAVDSGGTESVYSNQVPAVIPTP